jgi:hypothetical protein
MVPKRPFLPIRRGNAPESADRLRKRTDGETGCQGSDRGSTNGRGPPGWVRGERECATGTPPARTGCPPGGNPRVVPTFTMQSIGQGGARLYPGSIATATPQTFTMASPPTELNGFGVEDPRLTAVVLVRCAPAHIHQV